jgi:hypothetical protein
VWIGNALDARSVAAVLFLGIRAVIDLAASEPAIQYPRDIVYCRIPLNDGAEDNSATLRLAVFSTTELVKSQVRTLVACSAGMSRSPAIVAAALALAEGLEPDEALLRVASTGPHDVAPSLWREIKRVALSAERPGRILFYEYGTCLRLTEKDKLILHVLCGRTGQYGVAFELNDEEQRHYKTFGDAFIQELARKVVRSPTGYAQRGRTS